MTSERVQDVEEIGPIKSSDGRQPGFEGVESNVARLVGILCRNEDHLAALDESFVVAGAHVAGNHVIRLVCQGVGGWSGRLVV